MNWSDAESLWNSYSAWEPWVLLFLLAVFAGRKRSSAPIAFAIAAFIVVKHFEFSITEQCEIIAAIFFGVFGLLYPFTAEDAKFRYLGQRSTTPLPDDEIDYRVPPRSSSPSPPTIEKGQDEAPAPPKESTAQDPPLSIGEMLLRGFAVIVLVVACVAVMAGMLWWRPP